MSLYNSPSDLCKNFFGMYIPWDKWVWGMHWHVYWILPECLPEYLYQFTLLLQILAKLISAFPIFANLMGIKWCIIFASILIYQLTSDVEDLFIISPLGFLCFKLPINIFYIFLYSVSNFIPDDLQKLFVYSSFSFLASLHSMWNHSSQPGIEPISLALEA